MSYRLHWKDCSVDYYEGYFSSMRDFHSHDYYEISLILSGNVKVLLPDCVQEGTEYRLVLTRPRIPHMMARDPDVFYSRLNLLFSDDYVADYVPEWKKLNKVFGTGGRIIVLSEEQKELCYGQIRAIERESDPFRRRLGILLFLSFVTEIAGNDHTETFGIPHYVTEALTYIDAHYREKILAADLAWHLGIGRTTLMTSFKKYTGRTLNEYLTRCRVRYAIRYLQQGKNEEETAELCGFGDACGLIRSFQRCFGTSPRQYLKEKDKNEAPQLRG